MRKIVESLTQRAEAAMEARRFDAAAETLRQMRRLGVIDNVLVTQLLTIAMQRADAAVRNRERQRGG